jgi:hypothetical protein
MRPFWPRFLRHGIGVGVSLAIIGYFLAHAFLMSHRMYAAGAYNPDNERVLWQTPLVMATLGVLMTAALELVAGLFRKPAPVPATSDSVA